MKRGITKVPFESKMPGIPELKKHRAGIACTFERNKANLGQFIVYFGKRYALIDAVELHDKVFEL